jgi:NADH:ubiquinone oxidoreductase subunit 6 (subunit J)
MAATFSCVPWPVSETLAALTVHGRAHMEFLNFLREEPLIAWFVFLALLITVVPAVSVIWRRMSGRNQLDAAIRPVRATTPTRFGNQTELVILLLGLVLLLAVVGSIRRIFFG